MSSDLIELGNQALASVSSNVAGGAALLKCQLLASEFYEALRHELQKTTVPDTAERRTLIAAADQCHRIAMASISPELMVGELKRAVDLLNVEIAGREPTPPRSRPTLRVIQGGLS